MENQTSNINYIKQVLDVLFLAKTKIKAGQKILVAVITSVTHFDHFKLKEFRSQIKDLTKEEIQELIEYTISLGGTELQLNKLVANFESNEKTRIWDLIKIFI
jgi:predicted DNA-binding antitoxin AbrB/MazE fold protein